MFLFVLHSLNKGIAVFFEYVLLMTAHWNIQKFSCFRWNLDTQNGTDSARINAASVIKQWVSAFRFVSWDVCGAAMIIGRHISSAKERHFFLQKSCFLFPCPFRDKIKCLSKSQTSSRVHKAVIHIFPWYKKDYRAEICICRKKTWNSKPQLGFKMAHVVSDNVWRKYLTSTCWRWSPE